MPLTEISEKLTYPTLETLDFPTLEAEIRELWDKENVFEQSISQRNGQPTFTFYEGPPSANGIPGIHHVMARTIKDLFCRYKTLKGYQVHRKAGWDTHGLPVELQVEKTLGITKADIGQTITVAEYNAACRRDVMKYTDQWQSLTKLMGYWVDMQNPYITYTNEYIESVWYLLKRFYDKGLLYKGYTIQPYSPAAGTGLSSHELNLPGCYKTVKDTSVVAQFKRVDADEYFLAWTTTPWTLPSNTALAVNPDIIYVKIKTFNPYTFAPITVILAEALQNRYFLPELAALPLDAYKPGDKKIPFQVLDRVEGKDLVGLRYEQLLPYVQPQGGDPFRVIAGDFVTTEDGTGIVHIAPTFGSDDMRVAKQNNIPPMTVRDDEGNAVPLVDKSGKFVTQMGEFAGRFVKNYANQPEHTYKSVDIDIAVKLKTENKAFRVEKYEHNYPHCWRTDKPILYYPLDSWFIKASAYRQRMAELNQTINWKPASTGTGRFGHWLENVEDWNLSRSRFWGIPLPIWINPINPNQKRCIGSIAELQTANAFYITDSFTQCVLTGQSGNQKIRAQDLATLPAANRQTVLAQALTDGHLIPFKTWAAQALDLHKPYIDDVIIIEADGAVLVREADLIDVWFDSGAMPFAQHHYPFENQALFKAAFPADFIAEGIDQTRGWFYTLHAIAVMLEDSVAFKNVIANGLVLAEDGQKMSKRLGNAVDPFNVLTTVGADPTRWYMLENAPPWENLRFSLNHLQETQRRFFGTLFNTYQFFVLYANIDRFIYQNTDILPIKSRPELDRWILSRLHYLIDQVDNWYREYEPTRVARAIQHFVVEELSNWYVRLARRRFWKGTMTDDKQAAYQTLYECILTVAQLMSPIAPFFSDWLYRALTQHQSTARVSVHLTDFPTPDLTVIDTELDARMDIARTLSSLVRGLRRKVNLKVRQPLTQMLIPVLDPALPDRVQAVADLIKAEVNVKTITFIPPDAEQIVKKVKPDFKKLGPQLGPNMKACKAAVDALTAADIARLEQNGQITLDLAGTPFNLTQADVEIIAQDMPGWAVATENNLTVALDITLTPELIEEGIARDLVNRIQNLRKDLDFDVTDKIRIVIQPHPDWQTAIQNFGHYICGETLAQTLTIQPELQHGYELDIDDKHGQVFIEKIQ